MASNLRWSRGAQKMVLNEGEQRSDPSSLRRSRRVHNLEPSKIDATSHSDKDQHGRSRKPLEPISAQPSEAGKTPFPFLGLPTEVRLMIYRHALVLGKDKTHYNRLSTIIVRDLAPSDYQKRTISGSCKHRTAYGLHCHQNHPCPNRCSLGSVYNFCVKSSPMEVTSYTHGYHNLNLGLLSVNRQIWREAAPVFYGKNTFDFRSMSAVMPFLNDRKEFWSCFKNIRFTILLDWHGHGSQIHQHVFAQIANSSSLKLKHLAVKVWDPMVLSPRIKHSDSEDERRLMAWIDNLGSIRELGSLKIEYSLGGNTGNYILGLSLGIPQFEKEAAIELWCQLAPLVLRPGSAQLAEKVVEGFRRTHPDMGSGNGLPSPIWVKVYHYLSQ